MISYTETGEEWGQVTLSTPNRIGIEKRPSRQQHSSVRASSPSHSNTLDPCGSRGAKGACAWTASPLPVISPPFDKMELEAQEKTAFHPVSF